MRSRYTGNISLMGHLKAQFCRTAQILNFDKATTLYEDFKLYLVLFYYLISVIFVSIHALRRAFIAHAAVQI